jgi:nitrite reductase (NADH) small subunit
MNAMVENWIAVGRLEDIPLRGARRLAWGETTVALIRNAEDRLFAIEDKCPHKGGPLSQGIVHGDCVTCPLHNWVISLETGHAQGADEGSVRTFRVQTNAAGEILVCANDLASPSGERD